MLEDEEEVQGVYCVAAPLHDVTGNVVGSAGVIGLKSDLPAGGFEHVGAQVCQTTAQISAQLGYFGSTACV